MIAVTNRARSQHGRLPLVRGEQHSRPQGRGAARSYERERARRTALVVGELDDADAIIFAEQRRTDACAREMLPRLSSAPLGGLAASPPSP